MNKPSNFPQPQLGAGWVAQPSTTDGAAPTDGPSNQGTFWQRFKPLFAVGVIGVVALVPVISPVVESAIAQMPEPPQIPAAALIALSLVQPTLLMAGAVAIGTALAPKLGLRSHLVERATTGRPIMPALRAQAPLAAALGTAAALAIIVCDLALRPLLGAQLEPLMKALPHNTLGMTVGGVLGGGIFEELLMRWGFMTLLAWVGWRVVQKKQGLPRRGIMIGAIVGAALLFGLGHLPATATVVPLTPLIVMRALLLNGLAAVVYGWLFWRRSLESGMIAHATGHVVFTVVSMMTSFGH